MKYFLPCWLFALASNAFAQADPPYGDCPQPITQIYLESSSVQAPLFNNGAFFWRGELGGEYLVPKEDGVSPLSNATLWLGGLVDDSLRFSGGDFSGWEFRPGPLGGKGAAPTAEDCAAADRMYRVTLEDIARYNTNGIATADLAEWPFELGGPVVDGDGDPTNFNLSGGDRPAILGGETVWWVMNDRGSYHDWSSCCSGAPEVFPLGVEVRVTAFSVPARWATNIWGGLAGPASRVLDVSSFYRVDVTNGNTDLSIESLFAGFQVGIGSNDDFVGSDTLRNMFYSYDDNEFDIFGFGEHPPAFGWVILGGPTKGRLHTFANMFNNGHPDYGLPNGGHRAYRTMQGLYGDGLPFREGNGGFNQTGRPTRYFYSGDPFASTCLGRFWTMENDIDSPDCQREFPGFHRTYFSLAPTQLEPSQTATFYMALVWSRSMEGRQASLELLLNDVDRVQSIFDADLLFSPAENLTTITLSELEGTEAPPEPEPQSPTTYALAAHAWPNPVTTEAIIRYDLPEAATVRLSVFNVQGREVAVLVQGTQDAGFHEAHIDASAWPNGVYLYRLDAGNRRKASGVFTVLK